MSNACINFFKEPAPATPIQDKQEIRRKYTRFQWQILCSLYLGYVISYIGRKNLSIAMPDLCKALNLSNTKLGVLNSSFYITYGIGKFFNGMLSDRSNVKTFFSTALILAGMSIYCFALATVFSFLSISALVWVITFLWGANGWFQSMTFPPIAKSLTYWFAKKDRGIRWSVISTSHQIGVLASIAIATFAVSKLNWKWAFYLPGLITIAGGILLLFLLRDKPVTLGLPEVEVYKKSYESDSTKDENETELKAEETENVEEKVQDVEETKGKKTKYFELVKKNILLNPTIWLLVFSYMFIYVVRTATEDWLAKFFRDFRLDSPEYAASKVASLSIIGAIGTVLAGLFSDKFFKGKRAPVNMIFLIGLLVSLIGFSVTPNTMERLDYIYAALIGFFTAGLQNLVGLQIVEICVKEVAAAANGFAGMLSYFGATLSSIGTGFVIDRYSWNGAFKLWIISNIIAIVLFMFASIYENRVRSKANI